MFHRLLEAQTGQETHPKVSSARFTGSRRDFVLALIGLIAFAGCNSVPQVLSDEAAFGELDALYTAVTTKSQKLLGECDQRITKLHEEKRMSDAGFKEVQNIIAMAREDDWQPAAEKLWHFMRGQRKPK